MAHWIVYQSKKHIKGETRITITTHSDSDLVVCFKNHLDSNNQSIDLDIDIGANAVDYKAIAKAESLSELKVKMMKLEGIFNFSGTQLLKLREATMQDTNESTNFRAKNFTILTVTAISTINRTDKIGELANVIGAISRYQWAGWSFLRLPTRGMDMEDGVWR
ncbi:emp24/gp25L/p24 family/GOLD-domain-containing protein [Phakopsora pachyrhizi]|nr:emp24/gp25L/p24 family/GOLD-domain-containing protein [Phakopsora pachyrhizi]